MFCGKHISRIRWCWITSQLKNFKSISNQVQQFDEIFLKGMVFHGYHGVLIEEQKLGQKFVVDARLFCCLRRAGQSDNLNHTIDYAAVYTDIQEVLQGQRFELQEKVVSVVAQNLLKNYPLLQGVQLKIQKPHVALPGVMDAVGVEISRWRATDEKL
eukprot:TRINITY_DN5749_c0_g1_i1.p2 TRINITY_DN5749_c0_g1~~TRINITY_DN5749_c0_g1_i1.p2  ORF type:complete len:157 (-),score=19.48 TRINITY_DN5749_c0_g1_i1:201-671(-)